MASLLLWLQNMHLHLKPTKLELSNVTRAVSLVNSKGRFGENQIKSGVQDSLGCCEVSHSTQLVHSIAPMRAASCSPQGIHWHSPIPVPQQGDAPAAHTAQCAQDQVPAGANRGAQHHLSYPKFCSLRVKLHLSGYRGSPPPNNRPAAAPGCMKVQAGGYHLPGLCNQPHREG